MNAVRLLVTCEGTARRGCGFTEVWLGGAAGAIFRTCPQCGRKRRALTVTVLRDEEASA